MKKEQSRPAQSPRANRIAITLVAGLGLLAGFAMQACGGSSNGCPNCAAMVACCLAEADAGAPTGGICTNNPGEVTSRSAQGASCTSDPGIVQGDADSTCKQEFSGEGAKPNAPAACQNI